MTKNQTLITAAGGNGTAIEVLDRALAREEYESRGKILERDFAIDGVEQAGFLIPSDRHFEMAGGEFCGNATRSAAVVLHQICGKNEVSFTVSGFAGTVRASIKPLTKATFFVEVTFPRMTAEMKSASLEDGTLVSIVDLGGIVHIVIEGEFPKDEEVYTTIHRQVVNQFGLNDRDAVGVVWFQREGAAITIHPVVWVRAVDTFYYESSCGSGTIAVGRVTGNSSIVQPTKKSILVELTESGVTLSSEMEVVC